MPFSRVLNISVRPKPVLKKRLPDECIAWALLHCGQKEGSLTVKKQLKKNHSFPPVPTK